ncbi:hypothetical protein Agabi119p4_8986 [Agaricus bisporus var. burnettii]|uniref:Uncharacterized protein n=1 Tax=Agaricus bisporus var. burnettii TaxID=192524 RepID=A0A8H7C5G9_AGABI|nr:hypothetical protein Agabi119p4_8986 [Agaricus bisporus var. burnettii]
MDVDNVYHEMDSDSGEEDDEDMEEEQPSLPGENEGDEYVIQAADLNMVMTPKQREWFRNGKCLCCGGNHFARICPQKSRKMKLSPRKKGKRINPYRGTQTTQTYPPSAPKIATASQTVNAISRATVATNLLNLIPEHDQTEALKTFSDF